MKTFIKYWSAVVLGLTIIPSMVLAAGMVYFYGTGDAPSADHQSALISAISLFSGLVSEIALFLSGPAIFVLLVGIAVCLYKSSNRV